MDEILNDLREEGRLHSEGTFTLALEPAMRKLAERQFELPGLYLLKLIQAAVALKATAIRVKLKPAEVRFEADLGTTVSPTEVESLLAGPFQDFQSAGLRHLAWAWAAAASVKPQRAELQCAGRRLSLADGKLQLEPYEGAGGLSLRLQKGNVRWWQRLLPGRLAEHALISRAAGYCPVPLKLDGRDVDGSEPALGHWRKGKLRITTTAFWQPITCDYPMGHRLVFRSGGALSASPPMLVDSGTTAVGGTEINNVGLNFPGRPIVYSWKWPEPIAPIVLRGNYTGEHASLNGAYMLGFNSGWEAGTYFEGARMAFLALRPEDVEPFLSPGARRIHHELPILGDAPLYTQNFTMPTRQRVPICWAHLFLPADQPDGTGWLYPCLHGVLLDPVELDLGHPGAVAVVTADHLETDLSQLKVVQNASWEALLADVRSEIAAFRGWMVGSLGMGLLSRVDYLVMSHVQKRFSC